MSRRLSLDPPEPVSSPASSWSAEVRAPAGDERSEAEADLVASAAIRRWKSSRTTPSGGSPERLVANAVAPELASRPGALDNLRNVTFDASPAAAVQADAMGVRGFSYPDVAACFGRGGFRAGSRCERGFTGVSLGWGWPLRAPIWLRGSDRGAVDRCRGSPGQHWGP
jgi:hypothetical protein